MTEKQITIDYKNLCENYSKEVGCYNTFDGSCIQEQCFTYKLLQQLQAKEQECETLASQLDFEVQKKECLEQECEELKSLLKVRIEDLCDSCGASSMMPMPCKVYEKTLAEIKEIAENGKRFAERYMITGEQKANVLTYANAILQKISECEVK